MSNLARNDAMVRVAAVQLEVALGDVDRNTLPEATRAELVVDLLDSLDDRPADEDQAEVERVWAEETARRAAQIDAGVVALDSWDDVLAKVAESRSPR